jgi:hypothetical protein
LAAGKKCRNFTGRTLAECRLYFSMEVNPRPQVVQELKKQAEAQGLTLNAYLMPFLNDIAAGRLVRVPHYPAQQKAA